MGYKKDVIKGISWIGSLRFSTKVIGFLETVILARILAPEQFGAYGIALLALGLLEVITETGVNIVLLQESTIDEYISSAWVVSIVRGIVISILLYTLSPVITNFFHSPSSLLLLQLIATVPFLRGFINPSVVKFQKDLLFAKDFSYQFIILIIDTVVSITVCYLTNSPIGIAIGLIIGVIVELFLSFYIASPKPGLDFRKEYFWKIFHGGKWVTFSGIFDYLFENVDNLVVGRLLGPAALGIYQLAYSLAVVPLNEVGKVFVHVTTPIMVKMSHEPKRLQNTLFKSLLSVSVIIIPVGFIFIVFPYIIVWILGQNWAGIVAVLPTLALLGFVRSLSGVSSALFLSLKKQNILTKTMFVTIGVLLLLIYPFVTLYGIVGAGLSALIGSLCAVPVITYYVWRVFHNERI